MLSSRSHKYIGTNGKNRPHNTYIERERERIGLDNTSGTRDTQEENKWKWDTSRKNHHNAESVCEFLFLQQY